MSNTYSADNGFGLQALRRSMHLPPHVVRAASPALPASAAISQWLERLALWAERQPMHHHLGSYMLPR